MVCATDDVRGWIIRMDQEAEDAPDPRCVQELAKRTTTDAFLQSIRYWQTVDNIVTWHELKSKIKTTYLSKYDAEHLRRKMSDFKQHDDEAISAYVARFSSELNLSFGDLRTPEEERRVIGYFLKGVRDEKFARILLTDDNCDSLAAVMATATRKAYKVESFTIW